MKKGAAQLQGTVFLNGKIVKVTPIEGGGQSWRIYAGAVQHYLVIVPQEALLGRTPSVENEVRVFATLGRRGVYTAQDFEIRGVKPSRKTS